MNKLRFPWQQYAADEWFCPFTDVVLRVDSSVPAGIPDARWSCRIEIPEPRTVLNQVYSNHETIDAAAEMLENDFLGRYRADYLTISVAQICTLIEQKWGVSTNSFLPLSYPSLLDAHWSECYFPTLCARCFVIETKTQWVWVTVTDFGDQSSGTAMSLRHAKTKSILAALAMNVQNHLRDDADTLSLRTKNKAL